MSSAVLEIAGGLSRALTSRAADLRQLAARALIRNPLTAQSCLSTARRRSTKRTLPGWESPKQRGRDNVTSPQIAVADLLPRQPSTVGLRAVHARVRASRSESSLRT